MNEPIHAKTAQGLASMGRYGDSMLVHMTPGEVAGLQSLAVANGTSLTINPKTGLPEAFILAPLVGLGLKAAGMSALGAGIATGLLGWAVTGDLGQGLLSGLGGYGGAGLGGALGKFGATQGLVSPATEVAKVGASTAGAGVGAGAGTLGFAPNAASALNAITPSSLSAYAAPASSAISSVPNLASATGSAVSGLKVAAPTAFGAVTPSSLSAYTPLVDDAVGTLASTTSAPNMAAGFSKALADPKAFYDAFPNEALTGLGMAASPLITSALTPPEYQLPKEEKTPYEGPYYPTERTASFPTDPERQQLGTKEYQYFTPIQPYPGYESYDPNYRGYAEGGDVTETPDPGSNPLQDVKEAGEYGIGGLAYFAKGGNTGGPGKYVDPNSIPSAAFQADLDAYNKEVKDLMNPGIGRNDGAFTGGAYNPIYGLFGGMFRPSLSRAQAEAKVGPKPVWEAPTAPDIPVPAYATAKPGFQGSGITSLPPRQPTQNLNLTGGFSDMSKDIINSGGAFAKGGYLDGPGDGMSDSIPATIAGKQPARLADGEFVIPADVVSHLGNGSTKAGAQRLYAMMDKVRKARTGTKKQGKQINPKKYMPA